VVPHRTIHQLLAARAASDPLSDAEQAQLTEHQQRVSRALRQLEKLYPVAWGAWPESGAEFEALRDRILRDLDTKDADALRELVRLLLALVEMGDAFTAEASGRWHRQLAQQRSKGQQSVRSKRETAASIVDEIDHIRARRPTLTDTAAMLIYLRATDGWWDLTDAERDRKVSALERRVRRARARKNTGHEPR
jgi:hypothetical protein